MSCSAERPHMDFGCGRLKGWSNIPNQISHIDHIHSDTDLAKVVAIRMAYGKRSLKRAVRNVKVRIMLQCGPNSWVAEPDPSVDTSKYWGADYGPIDWEAEVYNPILGHEEARSRVIFDQPGRKQGKTSKLKDWFEKFKMTDAEMIAAMYGVPKDFIRDYDRATFFPDAEKGDQFTTDYEGRLVERIFKPEIRYGSKPKGPLLDPPLNNQS